MTLQEARDASGLTQQQLAERVGLRSGNAIGHYEAGKRTPPAWRAREIEKALGLRAGAIDWPRPREAGA